MDEVEARYEVLVLGKNFTPLVKLPRLKHAQVMIYSKFNVVFRR